MMTDQELVELAFTMLERSYVPYSHFPVGAALECADARYSPAATWKMPPTGSTICAERTALVKAISEGHRTTLCAWLWWAIPARPAGPAEPAARCSMNSPLI